MHKTDHAKRTQLRKNNSSTPVVCAQNSHVRTLNTLALFPTIQTHLAEQECALLPC